MAAVPKNNIYIVFSGKVIFYNIIFKSVGYSVGSRLRIYLFIVFSDS